MFSVVFNQTFQLLGTKTTNALMLALYLSSGSPLVSLPRVQRALGNGVSSRRHCQSPMVPWHLIFQSCVFVSTPAVPSHVTSQHIPTAQQWSTKCLASVVQSGAVQATQEKDCPAAQQLNTMLQVTRKCHFVIGAKETVGNRQLKRCTVDTISR